MHSYACTCVCSLSALRAFAAFILSRSLLSTFSAVIFFFFPSAYICFDELDTLCVFLVGYIRRL